MWRQFFGTGLSKTLDDLGSQGEWPTHPELLDWLAAEFMQPEWQAAGRARLGREAPDPHDRDQPDLPAVVADARRSWTSAIPTTGCWRGRAASAWMPKWSATSRSRSPGCWSRSSAARASSRIEPDGYLATLNFPKREYSASRGDDLYRRGVYTFWQRTFPASQPADVRRADARRVHGQSRELRIRRCRRWSAQRSDLRGSGARLRAEHARERRHDVRTSASTGPSSAR